VEPAEPLLRIEQPQFVGLVHGSIPCIEAIAGTSPGGLDSLISCSMVEFDSHSRNQVH